MLHEIDLASNTSIDLLFQKNGSIIFRHDRLEYLVLMVNISVISFDFDLALASEAIYFLIQLLEK